MASFFPSGEKAKAVTQLDIWLWNPPEEWPKGISMSLSQDLVFHM